MNSALINSNWGRKLAKKIMKGNTKKKPVTDKSMRWRIVRGDLVQVIGGPCLGQKGKILAVIRPKCRVIVEGCNMRTRNIKNTLEGTPGRRMLMPCSIHYSNVNLVDPVTGEPTKTNTKFLEDGTKVRVSKKTGQIIPKPDPLEGRRPRSQVAGPKDTAPEDVFETTFEDYEQFLPYIYESKKREQEASMEALD